MAEYSLQVQFLGSLNELAQNLSGKMVSIVGYRDLSPMHAKRPQLSSKRNDDQRVRAVARGERHSVGRSAKRSRLWHVSSLLLMLIFSTPAAAQEANVEKLLVTDIRAYTDGNMHISFNRAISSVCGGRLRVPNGPGQESVRVLALAAMMSGRLVHVSSESTRSGNFCNLIYIWLQDN